MPDRWGLSMKRIITKFARPDERYAGEIDATHIPLSLLAAIVHPAPDDPLMIFSYQITSDHAPALAPLISEKLDFDRYEYFIDAVR